MFFLIVIPFNGRFVGHLMIMGSGHVELDHLIQFYLNNAINLRPLTPHIMSCYTHKMAIVL